MTDPAGSNPTHLSGSTWRSPLDVGLATAWLVTTVTLVAMLVLGVRHTDRYEGVRIALHIAYAVVLLGYVTRAGAPLGRLPEVRPGRILGSKFGRVVSVLLVALLVAVSSVSDSGLDYVLLLLFVAAPWILVAWRRWITLRVVSTGLVLAVVAFLAGLPAWLNGFLSSQVMFLLCGLACPLFVAGTLLFQRTGLGGVSLCTDRPVSALRSFLIGCLLFVPLGLVNAVGGSPGSEISWVNQWWMPITLPVFSGVTEEILFRLALVGLFYYLVRPALGRRAAPAVVIAAVFGAAIFGLSHGRDLEHLLVTGLLYGLPMAWLFVKFNWEHAVGAHYMVNMIPWVMVFLEA